MSWRKPVRSINNGNCVEVGEDYRKSRFSQPGGDCLEVASGVLVRDTTDRAGVILSFPAGAWREFIASLR